MVGPKSIFPCFKSNKKAKKEQKINEVKAYYEEKLAELAKAHAQEIDKIYETNQHELQQSIRSYRTNKSVNDSPHDILVKDVESMSTVIELNNKTIKELRMQVQVLKLKEDELISCESQLRTATARVEDCEAQLALGREDRVGLVAKVAELEEALNEALGRNKVLTQSVDELSWKIKNPELVPISPSATVFKEEQQQQNSALTPVPVPSLKLD